MPYYQSTKTYGHDIGISCAFRQWKADSHCKYIHGYALSFKFTFECQDLDARNWCVDFGGLKWLKMRLVDTFDHKLVVAQDDPMLKTFVMLDDEEMADVTIMQDGVGCEKFAEFAYHLAVQALERNASYASRVRVVSCEVAEHGANSAIYIG